MNLLAAKVEIMKITMQMAGTIQWLIRTGAIQNEIVDEDDPVLKFFLAYMVTMSRYARAALIILNDPHTVRPPMGQRCIFY